MERIAGWDIGGAHLKLAVRAADGTLAVAQRACPVWQGMDRLEAAIASLEPMLGPGPRHHAVTMTAELVDLFPDRLEGVVRLVAFMRARFPDDRLEIYAGAAGFVPAGEAEAHAPGIASANWRASAELVTRQVDDALLVDIGSTTADLVPIASGTVSALGEDDHSRLVQEEMVYCGFTRTPLMAIADRAPLNGVWVPLMNEHFATTADIYRLLGWLDESHDQHPAADGGDKTVEASARRLARMLGQDVGAASLAGWRRVAAYFTGRQLSRLQMAAERVLSRGIVPDDAPVIGAGAGRLLAGRLAERLGRPYMDYSAAVGYHSLAPFGWFDTCAPAVAVALLAEAL